MLPPEVTQLNCWSAGSVVTAVSAAASASSAPPACFWTSLQKVRPVAASSAIEATEPSVAQLAAAAAFDGLAGFDERYLPRLVRSPIAAALAPWSFEYRACAPAIYRPAFTSAVTWPFICDWLKAVPP